MPKKIDYSNYENEYLRVLSLAPLDIQEEKNANNKIKSDFYLCECKNCNSEFITSHKNIKKIKSCGCKRIKYRERALKEIGNKYNRLTVISINEEKTLEENSNGKTKGAYMNFQCECGNIRTYRLQAVKDGYIKSCGCIKFNNPLIMDDLTGKKYNRLTVLYRDVERDKNNKNNKNVVHWVCKCDCGKIKSISSYQLKSGHTKSCGCYGSEILSKRNKEMSSKYNRPKQYKNNTFDNDNNYLKVYDENMENYFIIDEEDYDVVKNWYWRKITYDQEPNPRKHYWVSNKKKDDDKWLSTSLRLHQIIARIKYGEYDKKLYMPDHLSRNPDDNRKENIVLKSNINNSHNRGISRINKSGKTGVYSKDNKYTAVITNNYKTTYIGTFDTFEEAVKARKQKEQEFKFTCDDVYPDYDVRRIE